MNSSRDSGSVKNENCAIKMETEDKMEDVKWHVSRTEQNRKPQRICCAMQEVKMTVRRNAGQRDEIVKTAVSSGGTYIAVNKQAFCRLPGGLALAWFLWSAIAAAIRQQHASN